jgi:hypothetical protein
VAETTLSQTGMAKSPPTALGVVSANPILQLRGGRTPPYLIKFNVFNFKKNIFLFLIRYMDTYRVFKGGDVNFRQILDKS